MAEEHENQSVKDTDNSQKRESTRSVIAILYVVAFMIVIFAALIACWWQEKPITDQKDILVAISGVLSGPLGFIVGYYFKASAE